jgi:hypothetical protein
MEALDRDRLPRMLPVEESPLPLDEPRLPLPVEESLISEVRCSNQVEYSPEAARKISALNL